MGEGIDTGGQDEQVTVTQDRLGKLLTREKAQGERAAIKRLLSTLGLDSPKALSDFVTTQREVKTSGRRCRRWNTGNWLPRKASCRPRAGKSWLLNVRGLRFEGVLVALGAEGDDLFGNGTSTGRGR
ncbi:hypothetical protein [Streptomyces alboflavus]|uniref:hypothetical protein n=1 Tax=Streptomyces alboflavus TaxID=67267 RepID=UPI0012FE9F5F|nr:hypothetical protein [Streptomyces alboflavus]